MLRRALVLASVLVLINHAHALQSVAQPQTWVGAANTFGSDAQTLTITANAPILSPDEISTEDTDGDGFSDELEGI